MTSIPLERDTLARWSALPVGYPMPGVTVEIIDETGAALTSGQSGEIVIHGTNVSVGYLGRPDLTERAFGERNGTRFYRTGDWGHLDSEGLLFVTGRMDGQIKLSGYRIELGDIEENLRALGNVRDAVVLPVMKDGKPELLAAFVIPATRDNLTDLDLMLATRGALSQQLPIYMVPKKFIFLDGFPMTPNGKADRRKLTELL
jgi:D-alanine--poly(phosphoribitol) ligase subunit 1